MFRWGFFYEELLIVVHDNLKLNANASTEVQRLKEVCHVQVHVTSDPSMLSSIGSEVDSMPNSVVLSNKRWLKRVLLLL
jgi:hypothetical protein